jgi:tRNA dimethylallyltransferase
MPKSLPKILVIVGPTASGKTALAVALAKAFGGEIVSADSRLLYKGMDIGTAKPTARERRGVRHHLIDIVRPDETLTLSEYKARALRAIGGILKRGRLPVLIGGTGLYVQAIVDNFEIPGVPPDHRFRLKAQKRTPEAVLRQLEKRDPEYAARIGTNLRYAIRALEVMRATGKTVTELQKRGEPLFDALQIGLSLPKDVLVGRIARRVSRMKRAGLAAEVKRLAKKYSWDLPAMSGIGYRELRPYLETHGSLKQALEEVRIHTRKYAKRQMTWFKRDKRIVWLSAGNGAKMMVKNWLK